MDIQVEHIEDHTARLTVKLPADESQNARKEAARRLAKEFRIPGFRPGKAPYNVVLSRFGEEAILEEIGERIGNTVYRKALEQAEIDPAAPGSFTNISDENGQLILEFLIPKSAEVDLKNYRDIRLDLDVQEVTDDMVNEVMENLREQRAVVEEVQREARPGDELELDLIVTWWHEGDYEYDEDEDEDDYLDGFITIDNPADADDETKMEVIIEETDVVDDSDVEDDDDDDDDDDLDGFITIDDPADADDETKMEVIIEETDVVDDSDVEDDDDD
ncbi:MAG TPA: trigger factor family protein, partial [Aggregatilineales bacterium]|nr:trigger factor family protein [Aggregatilineales bacterium]